MLSDITGRDFGGMNAEPGKRQLSCAVALNHVYPCVARRHLNGLGLLLQLEYRFPFETFWWFSPQYSELSKQELSNSCWWSDDVHGYWESVNGILPSNFWELEKRGKKYGGGKGWAFRVSVWEYTQWLWTGHLVYASWWGAGIWDKWQLPHTLKRSQLARKNSSSQLICFMSLHSVEIKLIGLLETQAT